MKSFRYRFKTVLSLFVLALSGCGGDTDTGGKTKTIPAYTGHDILLAASATQSKEIASATDKTKLSYQSKANKPSSTHVSTLPEGWANIDIGSPAVPGFATYSDGQFFLGGNGYVSQSIESDSFHFIYQPLQGNGEIVAQLTKVHDSGHWAYQGLMIRETLEADSEYASNQYYKKDRISYFRGRQKGVMLQAPLEERPARLPDVWLKLERVGDVFITSISDDGENWDETYRETIAMSDNVFIGLAGNANHQHKISTGTWQNVRVSGTSNALLPPTNLTAITRGGSGVSLTWQDNANNETGYRVERAAESDSLVFESFAVLSPNSTYLVDNGLEPATTYHYRISALKGPTASGYSNVVNATTMTDESQLPDVWSNTDIGSPNLAGFATYSDGQYFISGNGWIREESDSLHFVYQSLEGDGEVVAKLVTAQNAGHWGYHGLMVRETLDADAQYVSNIYYKNNDISIVKGRRNEEAINVSIEGIEVKPAVWLKLERSDDLFITFISDDGENWQETHRETIAMADNVFIGLTANAHTPDKFTKGTWENANVFTNSDQLAPPTNLTTEASVNDEVTLTWQDNANNETGFRIERAIQGESLIFEVLAEVGANTTFYQDDGLTLGTSYIYRIVAINGNNSSHYSEQTSAEVLRYEDAILYMQRLAGDYDKTDRHNVIKVSTTADSANNVLRHPGMIGKEINVELENSLSSSEGTISFKITPNTHQQTTEFFSSDALTISQVEEQLLISANGIENTYSVALDSVACNHVAIRFKDGVMSPYINGEWFKDVNIGAFDINSLTLQQYDGKVWDVLLTDSQLSNDVIYERSERCTNAVETTNIYSSKFPNRLCGVYSCLWVENELQLKEEKKRVYLYAQDIAYDRNTFDAQMYLHPDLDAWTQKERNLIANGFDDFNNFESLFNKNQGNTNYWLHENFHSYQVPLLKGGKWLAEATACWASWNYYKEPLPGYTIGGFTLNPHMGMFEVFAEGGSVSRYYHSSVMLVYITSFLTDDSIIGKLYNTPEVERNAFKVLINLLEQDGYDFADEFAEFAARTTVWDYPDPKISDALRKNERKSLNYGSVNNKLVDTFSKVGTYGIYHTVPTKFLPGAYAWNSYKVESTTAGTYTLKVKGSNQNTGGLHFIGKVVKGMPGSYEYVDFPIGAEVSLGNGEATVEVTTKDGEELFLTVVAISEERLSTENVDFVYEYAIESSEHPLPNDHIRTFVLPEQTEPALIDHKNHTVISEVERGTDVSILSPTVTFSDGAFSSIASDTQVDFTDTVVYSVTGLGNSEAKDWAVTVTAVPPRSDTDIVTFELENISPFSTIDNKEHTVSANLLSTLDLTAVTPIFSLSDGATSVPASGEVVDLTNPVNYTVTAEDGTTVQSWTVSVRDFHPFITTWQTDVADTEIKLSSKNFDVDYQYTWKDANGLPVQNGSVSSAEEEFFNITLADPGTYTLEIVGHFPNFGTPNIEYLKDVNQWGDIPWQSMALSFSRWKGEGFSATDLPDLSNVTSMFGMFSNAKNFNSDISQWDVSNVTDMQETFSRANSFSSDISGWDVSNVNSMFEMFRETRAFNSDLSRWDMSSVNIMNKMFFSASAFDQDLSSWNVTNVFSMDEMFDRSGLSDLNYDKTLMGWSEQNVRQEVNLGALNRGYCEASIARHFLINELSWTITGDVLACP